MAFRESRIFLRVATLSTKFIIFFEGMAPPSGLLRKANRFNASLSGY